MSEQVSQLQSDKKVVSGEELFQATIHFEPTWCEQFFHYSGSSSFSLYGEGGVKVVQTAAVLTKLETEIGYHFSDHRIMSIYIDTSKGMLFHNDKVILHAFKHGKGEGIITLDLSLEREGGEVLKGHAILASPEAADWEM